MKIENSSISTRTENPATLKALELVSKKTNRAVSRKKSQRESRRGGDAIGVGKHKHKHVKLESMASSASGDSKESGLAALAQKWIQESTGSVSGGSIGGSGGYEIDFSQHRHHQQQLLHRSSLGAAADRRVGQSPSTSMGESESESEEAARVRRMVARKLVKSQQKREEEVGFNEYKATGRQIGHQRQRMLDREDLSTAMIVTGSSKAEALLTRSAQYLDAPEVSGMNFTSSDLCCICLEPLQKIGGGLLRLNECKHVYHGLCILKWLELKQCFRCPLCKAELA